MDNLVVREVDFNGTQLMAVQDKETGKISVGVRWICEGIGLTKGQMQAERLKIHEDLVLSKGERNLVLPTKGGNQEVLCIELDFLPLWLAKISITPKMQEDQPEVADNLIQYQLKAKDVLAEAFIAQLSKRKKPIDIAIKQNFNIARTIVEHTGIKPGIAYATAITEAERETGQSLDAYKILLPPLEKDEEIGGMNATAVGSRIGLNAKDVNILLSDLGLQVKDDKQWRLTDTGKEYGEEFPYQRNGHSDYRILWYESLFTALPERAII